MRFKIWRQCQALDKDGKRCRARDHLTVKQYHGNGEIYGHGAPGEPWPTWVHVVLCRDHRPAPAPKETPP